MSFLRYLVEQRYSNTNRLLYHGSNAKFDGNHPNINLDTFCFWVTTSKNYAMHYSKTKGVGNKFLYIYTLKKDVNIFNPRSKTDYSFFMKSFNFPDNVDKFLFMDKLTNVDWLKFNNFMIKSSRGKNVWIDIKRQDIINFLIGSNFDGFFNKEKTSDGHSVCRS